MTHLLDVDNLLESHFRIDVRVEMLRAGGTIVRALFSLLFSETSVTYHADHNQQAHDLDLG